VPSTVAPVGILGNCINGFAGCFYGDFLQTLNAAQAYVVNDIYPQIHQSKHQQNYYFHELYCGRGCGSFRCDFLGFFAKTLTAFCNWIVGGLCGGLHLRPTFKSEVLLAL